MSAQTRASPLIAAARQAASFDRSAVDWRGGLMAAIPAVAAFGIPIAAGDSVAAATMGAGAMLVGVAWRARGGRAPLAAMALDSLAMGLATFVGSVAGSVLWLHLAVLVVVSLLAGLLFGLGNRGGVIGTQAVIAAVVFGRFPEPAGQAAGLAGLVLAGGFAQVLFQTLVRWPSPLRAQRQATAAGYRALAALAGASGGGLAAGAALDDAADTLGTPTLFGDQAVIALRSLVDEGYRIRVTLTAIHTLSGRTAPATAAAVACADALREAVDALTLAAAVLAGDLGRSGELSAAVGELSRLIDAARDHRALAHDDAGSQHGAFAQGDATAAILGRRLAALAAQLRAVAGLAEPAARDGRLRSRRPRRWAEPPLRRLQADIWRLRDDLRLDSPIGRHALRLAVIVPAMELVARELPISRGYWMVVAAAAVLRPEYGATFTRGAERALGTSAGVALAGAIAVTLHPGAGASVAFVGAFALLAYTTFPGGFAVGYAFVTALVVFLLNAVSPDTLATAGARLLDTLVGGPIGLLAYAAWPTWSALPAREALAALVAAERRYLSDVLAAWIAGATVDGAQMRPVARRLRLARVNAEATVARSLSEPSARQIQRDRARGALDSMLRLTRATHVLRLDAQERDEPAPMPALMPLAGAIDGVLAASETALRSGAPAPGPLPDARAAYERLTGTDGDLATQLDELVDAANGVAAAVGRDGDQPS